MSVLAGRRVAVFTTLAVALLLGVFLSATTGQFEVSVRDVIGALMRPLGLEPSWGPVDQSAYDTLWYLRFPRLTMSLLVGGVLAVAGAVMQAIFGNPLAEPGVVGVSSGAALGAAVAIVTGVAVGGAYAVALMAFAGGALATILVYVMARSGGRTEVVTLLLTGIAVNAFATAGLAFVLFAGDASSREQIIFWQLGTMNGSRWAEVLIVAVVGVIATAAALGFARQFDLLSLGERTASHLGVRVERLRIISIIVVALLTGVGVAFVGVIAFVGLVVPHIMRMVLGPSHRPLLVACFVGGGVLMVGADLLARTVVTGADLPIGMLTALIGGPFFFYLLRRARTRAGGWA